MQANGRLQRWNSKSLQQGLVEAAARGSVKCRVWSVECGVWSVNCGVWSVKCAVSSEECKV